MFETVFDIDVNWDVVVDAVDDVAVAVAADTFDAYVFVDIDVVVPAVVANTDVDIYENGVVDVVSF